MALPGLFCLPFFFINAIGQPTNLLNLLWYSSQVFSKSLVIELFFQTGFGIPAKFSQSLWSSSLSFKTPAPVAQLVVSASGNGMSRVRSVFGHLAYSKKNTKYHSQVFRAFGQPATLLQLLGLTAKFSQSLWSSS